MPKLNLFKLIGVANIATFTNIFNPLAFSIVFPALTLINNKVVWKGSIDISLIPPYSFISHKLPSQEILG
jgi:hypothetical protein